MGGVEFAKAGQDDPVPIERGDGEGNLARQFTAGQGIRGFCDFMKRGAQPVCEGARVLGRRDLSGPSLEKFDAERLFERFDLMADGRLRDVELLRGPFEAFEPGRGLEGPQLIHVGKAMAHFGPRMD